MTPLPTTSPTFGINPNTDPFFSPVVSPVSESEPEPEPSNDFARLARLTRSNESLFSTQRDLAVRRQRARAYLADPACNPNLAKANLEHLRAKSSETLTVLRMNRLEAQALLARLGPPVSPADPDQNQF